MSHDGVILTRKTHRFQVNLGDQRAGGINYLQLALPWPPAARQVKHHAR